MPDLSPRPALPFPAQGNAALRLEPMREGHVLQVLASPGATVSPDALAALSDGGAHAVRTLGPNQWLIVGDEPLPPAQLREQSEGSGLAVSDQSGGRVRILVSGPQARFLLAKGSAVDWSAATFPIGHATPTLFNHIGVHVTRTGEDRFELLVLRSFALSLWEELVALSAGTLADAA